MNSPKRGWAPPRDEADIYAACRAALAQLLQSRI